MGGNVIIFGADMSSSAHIGNKNKDISILREGPTQRLDVLTLTTEAYYIFIFTQINKIFVLSLHYNGSSTLFFVNTKKIFQFKAKTLKQKTIHFV